MGEYEKAYLYFDTNALECRHSGKSLFLSRFTVSPLYYEIEDLIRTMGLRDKVEICIPEIVWFEIQEHLVSHYRSEKTSMETKIASFRKSFGNLAEVTYEWKDCRTESEYTNYVTTIAQDFLENPRVSAKIIPCPKDEDTMQQIIGQAVNSVKPFRTAKANGKEYTDAGFKDALIFNTLLKHTENQLGIFISNDSDFSELFNEKHNKNLKMCNAAKDVQMILPREFNVISTDMIEGILKTDNYLIQRILSECELDENAQVYNIKILSCESIEDSYNVNFVAMINGLNQSFDITYNINANELLAASYEPFEEGEDK